MKYFVCIITTFIGLCTHYSFGQQQHFSLFQYSGIFLNPAETGNFAGDYRLSLLSKRQWGSFTEPYQGFSLGAERKEDSSLPLNIGINFTDDVAGDSQFKNTLVQVHLAKTFSLNLKNRFTLGVTAGYEQFSFDNSRLNFGNQFTGGIFNPLANANEDFLQNRSGFFTLGTGFLWQYQVSTKSELSIGSGAMRINQPEAGFYLNTTPVNLRANHYIRYKSKISNDVQIEPMVLYSTQGNANEFILASQVVFFQNESEFNTRAILANLGYRWGDALFLGAGYQFNNTTFVIAYDVNTSNLTNSTQYQGGWEIALHVLFTKPKTLEKGPRFCPLLL
ncbi:MAG: PorP/SprF family type IX secretion system membrane protein [Luteibaculaceae bacterium]